MTLSVAVFAAGGFFLDRKLGLGFPVGTLVGFGLGFIAGFWALVRGLDRPRTGSRRPDDANEGGSGR
ncbi:MAG: AtpZ/AtpI family protein [Planctomycetes bacterium]|nr:AtpZ/AtpI family protein [Planctomycetota bacterium]